MKKQMFLLIGLVLLLAACGGENGAASSVGPTSVGPTSVAPTTVGPTATEPRTLTLMSHDSFAISEEVLAEFEAAHNATVVLLPSGDTGAALNQAILAKDNPLADLFFGVDSTFMSRALAADIFVPYQSPALADVDDRFELDDSYRLLPVDYGDVCLNYDVAWFDENGLPLPTSLADLTDPRYAGLLVTQNPATSSPGLAFLLATISQFGTEGDYTYLDFWADLRANDVLITSGWEEAYYGHFTVASEGERPLVVSYASSPPAEVIFADPPVDSAPSASLVGDGMCYRQIEFVGILQGTAQRELAEAFVDFMLGETFQADIPLQMFVFPVNENAALPAEFTAWAQVPPNPVSVDPADIEANRESWLEAWTEVVLR
jgi:thiamine transport system substrate-binding protein